MKIVVLDAGHGGADVGAINKKFGLHESTMALDVVLRAKEILEERNISVKLTRSDDTFLSLSERYKFSNEVNADCFVSYHFNSASNPNVEPSWEIFTTKGQNRSDKLASAIGKYHGGLFPEQKKRQDWSDGDLDKEANFAVIRGTNCPSCLVEGEFIHTDAGAEIIKDPHNRQLMALAVANGICEFLEVPHVGKPSMMTVEQRLLRLEKHLGF